MHIWIERLSNKWKAVVMSISAVVFIVALCLLISAIANDRVNKFAKVFYIQETIQIKDDRWKDFLAYAQEEKLDPKHINKLREIFGENLTIEHEYLNSLGFSFFNFSMVLLMFICYNSISASVFMTIKLVENNVDRLRRESLIDQSSYHTIIKLLNEQREKNIKQKNSTINMELLEQQIENEEQLASEVIDDE